VKPSDEGMVNWLSEESALDIIEQACQMPGMDESGPFWFWEQPKPDARGFLRVRARHSRVKVPGKKFFITTQPFRCRVYYEGNEQFMLVNKTSIDYFRELAPDFGLKNLYPLLFEPLELVVPDTLTAKSASRSKKRKVDVQKLTEDLGVAEEL
jgi:hypothetical protein